MRIFDSAASTGQRRWCWDQSLACCATPGRPEFSQATREQNSPECTAHRGFLRWVEGMDDLRLQSVEGLGIAGSGTGVSGSPGSENEVMAQGLQRSPSALSGPEAPSHLCAVWPSGRQLLPLIIPPNGWIRFPLTSSSLHNNIPPSQIPFSYIWRAEQAQLGLWKSNKQPTDYRVIQN